MEIAWVQIVDEILCGYCTKEGIVGICSVCGHNLNDGDYGLSRTGTAHRRKNGEAGEIIG